MVAVSSLPNGMTLGTFQPLVALLRPRDSDMGVSRLISLVIAALYVVAFVCAFVVGAERDAEWEEDIFRGAIGVIFWLALSLGCIWFGDELGEGLIGAMFRGMIISSPSPGWAVKLMGWILLLLPAVIFFFYWIDSD